MKNINFNYGKETEKAIKQFLGLPAEVSGKGEIDIIYQGQNIEVKRGACALYVGKRFNRYRKASNAVDALRAEAWDTDNNGTMALTRSERVIYSIDGTIEHTYIMSTTVFLRLASESAKLYKVGKNKKSLQIVPNKAFLEAVSKKIPLARWKEWKEGRA